MVEAFGSFDDFLKVKEEDESRDFDYFKVEKNKTVNVLILSKITNEGKNVDPNKLVYTPEYSPPFVSGGWSMDIEGQKRWFVGLPKLNETYHIEHYPEQPFVQVGEVLGLAQRHKFLMWVADSETEEVVPMIYQPPKTVVEKLGELEMSLPERDLRGRVVTIKREDPPKGTTKYNANLNFSGGFDAKMPIADIEAIEFPLSLGETITLDTVEKQIKFVLELKPLIEKFIEIPFPFDEDGNLITVK